MEYLAHQTEDRIKKQLLKHHLENTAELCKAFSVEKFKQLAYICGLCHDIGKYSIDFQKRINGANIRVQHSIGGANEVLKDKGKESITSWIAAFCIAGHHTGIPDGGTDIDSKDDNTLLGRLKNKGDFSEYKKDITIGNIMTNEEFTSIAKLSCKSSEDLIEFYAFVTRYIYSCLTDADFIDTERFFKGDIRDGLKNDFEKCRSLLLEYMADFKQDTPIRIARNKLLNAAMENVKKNAEIYLMNMPTGSGKTLCSLRVALERIHMLKNTPKKKRRIIYVIPYTSIIEQTADIFEKIFEGENVLQHHSNYYYELKSKSDNSENYANEMSKRLKLSSENWDAEFIITTDVQFFESLYHYKSSHMRKIHNMADSIIIFDEIHTMPKNYLEPCIRGIGYITKYLNSEAVFMTATMPNFKDIFKEYIPFCRVEELVDDRYNNVFKKCNYKYRGELSDETLIMDAEGYKSTLIVVNKRMKARDLYTKFKEVYKNANIYHLSTYMTGYDRSNAFADIRKKLASDEKVIIISTSLIEAGVDIDCQMAYREISGLDSILQTGGRCNREGLRKDSTVSVFSFNDEKMNTEIKLKANITKSLFKEYDDIDSSECINEYYSRYYDEVSELQKQSIAAFGNIKHPKYIPFRTYSGNFKFINSNTVSVIVKRDKYSEDKINELKYGSKEAVRALRKYSATVYVYEFERLLEEGVVNDYGTGAYILTNPDYYDKETGLIFDGQDYFV